MLVLFSWLHPVRTAGKSVILTETKGITSNLPRHGVHDYSSAVTNTHAGTHRHGAHTWKPWRCCCLCESGMIVLTMATGWKPLTLNHFQQNAEIWRKWYHYKEFGGGEMLLFKECAEKTALNLLRLMCSEGIKMTQHSNRWWLFLLFSSEWKICTLVEVLREKHFEQNQNKRAELSLSERRPLWEAHRAASISSNHRWGFVSEWRKIGK